MIKHHLRIPFCAAIFLSMVSHGHASRVPADYSTMPLYFAGAACRASGAVDEIEGEPIVMNLYIDGELVAHWDWFEDIPDLPNGLQVMFDSSHFQNGSLVTVEFEAFLLNGQYTYSSGTSVVQNNAVLYGRNDFEVTGEIGGRGVPEVRVNCMQSNYHILYENVSFAWHSGDFYNNISHLLPNVCYVNTHGKSANYVPAPPVANPPTTFLYSDRDENSTPAPLDWYYHITPAEIDHYLILMQGTSGLPPYNLGGRIPYNIQFNDACETGNDNAFAEAFLLPYYNAYGGFVECQAQLGWSIQTKLNATSTCQNVFWSSLQSGYTADQARLFADDAYRSWLTATGNDEYLPEDPRSLLHVFGDWDMRLHGVYTGTGDDSPVTNWYGERILL